MVITFPVAHLRTLSTLDSLEQVVVADRIHTLLPYPS